MERLNTSGMIRGRRILIGVHFLKSVWAFGVYRVLLHRSRAEVPETNICGVEALQYYGLRHMTAFKTSWLTIIGCSIQVATIVHGSGVLHKLEEILSVRMHSPARLAALAS